jgi:SulP family sulfate permease
MAEKMAEKRSLIPDLVAGLTTGIANIPDAMASAILAGVNPVFGLYALMVGTPVGALLTSSNFMLICTTSAMALTAGSALSHLSGPAQNQALFTLTLLVGLFMMAAGLLRLGRLMRFVSNAVMVGFLTGVSVLVVLSQLGDFTGYGSAYSNKVASSVDILLHPAQIDGQTMAIGLLTVLLILAFDRTRLRNFSMLLAMIIASAVVVLLDWQSVQQVSDVAVIPGGLPLPGLPKLSLIPELIAPALSIMIIGLVQGAGVSKAYPNPDGNYPDLSRDFFGQGAANTIAGFFHGMPIGGSVSSTALNVSAGAKSRWAGVFSGLVIVIVVLLFSRAVSVVAMPAMAALLIMAGIQSIKVEEVRDVWDVGWGPRIVMAVTFASTLMIPVQYAVFAGVVLSILAYLISSSQDVQLFEITPLLDGTYREQPAPEELPGNAVTVLDIRGSVFFAAAYRLEEMLPSAREVERPVVIFRLRQSRQISSTFVNVLEFYDAQLRAQGGKLMLSGVGPRVKEQLDLTETTQDVLGEEAIYLSTDIIGDSTKAALEAASVWLEETADKQVNNL